MLELLKIIRKKLCYHKWEPDGIVPINWDLLLFYHCPVRCSKCGKRDRLPNYMFKTWPEKWIDKRKKY